MWSTKRKRKHGTENTIHGDRTLFIPSEILQQGVITRGSYTVSPICADEEHESEDVQNQPTSLWRLSSSSGRPSDISSDRRSTPYTSATNGDYSTGESGYETIERPTAQSTSDEQVNDLTDPDSQSFIGSHAQSSTWFENFVRLFDRMVLSVKAIACLKKSRLYSSAILPNVDHPCNMGKYSPGKRSTKVSLSSAGQLPTHFGTFGGPRKCATRNSACFGTEGFQNSHIAKLSDTEFILGTSDNLTKTRDESDSISFASVSDFVDPVYSKIPCSLDNIIQTEDESQFENEVQLCEFCWKRGSISSSNSQHTSAHPSEHIYYHLCKPSGTGGLFDNLWHSCREKWLGNSVLTSRGALYTQPLLDTQTPPELPARMYGQSTVNLVDRLRRLLKTKHSPTKLPVRCLQKSNTLSATNSDSTHSLFACGLVSRHSLVNVNPVRTTNRGRTNRRPLSSGPMGTVVSNKRDSLTSRLHCEKKPPISLQISYPLCSQIKRNQSLSNTRSYRSDGTTTSLNAPVAKSIPGADNLASGLQQQECSSSSGDLTWTLKLAARDPADHNAGPGSQSDIRHIDSELDIRITPHEQSLHQRAPSPLCHIYIPCSISANRSRSMAEATIEPTNNKRFWSPTHRTLGMESIVTMSPLMERSLEDEETRRLLLAH